MYTDPFGLCFGPLVMACPAIVEGAMYLLGAVIGVAAVQDISSKLHVESRRFPKAVRDEADAANKAQNDGELRCTHCGGELTEGAGKPNSREHDHRVPHAQGGPSDGTNVDETCRTCNRNKGNQTPEQWTPEKRWYNNPE
jgi:5-methylcytosine-specific restriction endonuclease McrA